MNGRWQTGRHTSGGGSIQRYFLVIAPGESIKANGHHFIFVGIWNSYIPSCMQRHKASVWENTSGVLLAWLLVGTKTTSVWEPEMHWCVVHCPSVFSLRESRGLLQGSHAQQKRSAGRSCCLGFSRANLVRIWISRTCHWRLQNLQKSLQCTSCLIEFCFGKSGDTSCWQEQSVHCAMRYCPQSTPWDYHGTWWLSSLPSSPHTVSRGPLVQLWCGRCCAHGTAGHHSSVTRSITKMLLGMPRVHQAAGALVPFPRQYLPLTRGLGAAASPRRAGLVFYLCFYCRHRGCHSTVTSLSVGWERSTSH